MSDSASAEMSLAQWCGQLPRNHRVNRELAQIFSTIGLLNSMICCGEQHSETSMKEIQEAFRLRNG